MSDIRNKANSTYFPVPNIKITTCPNSPPNPKLSRQQPIVRTNSHSKPPRRTSTEKHYQPHLIEKSLKFSRQRPEGQEEQSFASETNLPSFFAPAFEESTETIQKGRIHSKDKQMNNSLRVDNIKKPFDVLSGISGSSPLRGQEYYTYWKTKAHQYLQSNMKLMADIRRLNQQNETLKEQISKLKRKDPPSQEPLTLRTSPHIKQPSSKAEKSLGGSEEEREARKMSLHYLSKIEEMEKELKKKEVVIGQYQEKIGQLSHRVAGDNERVRLMARMKQELQKLREEREKEERLVGNSSFATLQINSPPKKAYLGPSYGNMGSYEELPPRNLYSTITQKDSGSPWKF